MQLQQPCSYFTQAFNSIYIHAILKTSHKAKYSGMLFGTIDSILSACSCRQDDHLQQGVILFPVAQKCFNFGIRRHARHGSRALNAHCSCCCRKSERVLHALASKASNGESRSKAVSCSCCVLNFVYWCASLLDDLLSCICRCFAIHRNTQETLAINVFKC
jgi:hypothetical protein